MVYISQGERERVQFLPFGERPEPEGLGCPYGRRREDESFFQNCVNRREQQVFERALQDTESISQV